MEAGEPSYVKIVDNDLVNGKRVYDLVINSSAEVFFTDVERWWIGKIIEGHKVEYVVGSGRDELRDGCQETASFVQPTGLCSEGDSLYVIDTGDAALKLITPTKPMAIKFMENVCFLSYSHGIRCSTSSMENCTTSLEKATAYFERAIEDSRGPTQSSVFEDNRERTDDVIGVKENQEQHHCLFLVRSHKVSGNSHRRALLLKDENMLIIIFNIFMNILLKFCILVL